MKKNFHLGAHQKHITHVTFITFERDFKYVFSDDIEMVQIYAIDLHHKFNTHTCIFAKIYMFQLKSQHKPSSMLECLEHNKYHSKLWLQMYIITKQEKKDDRCPIIISKQNEKLLQQLFSQVKQNLPTQR